MTYIAGKIYICKRAINLIITSAPLCVSYSVQVLMMLIDVTVAARLEKTALSALSAASAFYSMSFLLCVGFVSAIVPRLAEAVASSRNSDILRVVRQGLIVVLLTSTAACVLMFTVGQILSYFSYSNQLIQQATLWSLSAAPGLLFMLMFVFARIVCIALGSSGWISMISVVAVPVNAFLAVWLGLGIGDSGGLGLLGLGIAGSFTRLLLCVLGIMSMCIQPQIRSVRKLIPLCRPRSKGLASELRHFTPPAIRLFLGEGLSAATTLLVTAVDLSALASHAVAARVAALATMPLLALSAVTAARLGQSLNQKDDETSQELVWAALFASLLLVSCISLIILLNSRSLVLLLVGRSFDLDDATSFGVCVDLMPYVSLFQAASGLLSVAAGALLGANLTIFPVYAMLVFCWGLGLGGSFISTWLFNGGIFGIWACIIVGYFLAGIICFTKLFHLVHHRFSMRRGCSGSEFR